MKTDQMIIEKRKEQLDTFVILLFIIWIGLRIVSSMEMEGFRVTVYFFQMLIVFSSVFLITLFVFYSRMVTDELQILNRYKASRVSWALTTLVTFVLYFLNGKGLISGTLSLEILLWTGYLSYFLSFKFIDKGLFDSLSAKTRRYLQIGFTILSAAVLGSIFGYTMEDVQTNLTETIVLFSMAVIAGILFWFFAKHLIKQSDLIEH